MTKYTFTGQYSYMGDFGLMFYCEASRAQRVENARMYDPALGRFTSADTIIPPGLQGLDRYAYVNNAPVMYVDPSGHFTQTAIYNYLYRQCLGGGDKNDDKVNARAEKCASSTMATWQADEDWWDMISTAQAEGVLFGTFGSLENPQISGQFSVRFTGQGNTSLDGIEYISGATSMQSITLIDIQNSVKSTPNPFYNTSSGSPTIETPVNWYGFYVLDENRKPSFYVRRGVEWRQTVNIYGGVIKYAGNVLAGSLLTYTTAGLGETASGLIGILGGSMLDVDMADILDVEGGDTQVQIGPIYFNFQQLPNGTWMMEK